MVVEQHVDPPPISLIKSKHDDNLNNDFVKQQLRRDPISEKSDLCEFKMTLFGNGNLEELLLFVCNSSMTIEDSVTMEPSAKSQLLSTLGRGEALCHFYLLSSDV